MNAEDALRWGATVAALIALASLASILGVSVSPAVAAAVVLAVSGAVACVLWRRRLDERELEQARRQHAPEPFTGPAAEQGKY